MKRIILIMCILFPLISLGQGNFFRSYSANGVPVNPLIALDIQRLDCYVLTTSTISYDGGFAITERGVVIAGHTAPTTSDDKYVNGSGMGEYVTNVPFGSYTPTKYVRAYLINSKGTFYSNEMFFYPSMPIYISSITIDNIESNGFSFHGTVDVGGYNVTELQVRYGTGTLSNSTAVSVVNGTFNGQVSGLAPSTLYYFMVTFDRCGLQYQSASGVQSLTTSAPPPSNTIPDVNTMYFSNITSTSFRCYSEVFSTGGVAITRRGIVIRNTTPVDTTTYTQKIINNGQVGSYYCDFSGLSPNTTYYVKAFAKNSIGLDYGQQLLVSTLSSCVASTVTTNAASSITYNTAVLNGNISSDGGCSITERGFVVGLTSSVNYNSYNYKFTSGTSTGSYSISGGYFSANTLYYVKAFSVTYINGVKTVSSGSYVTFTTSPALSLPIVSTNDISSIANISALGGGDVTSSGGASVTRRGICYSSSNALPDTTMTKVVVGSGTGYYLADMTGLSNNTTYYVRAWAKNSVGVAYGSTKSFTTQYIQCGNYFNNDGGHIYPGTYTVDLGTSTGYVSLSFDAYEVPDKLDITWDGNLVLRTGYISTYFPDSPTELATQNALLAAALNPDESIESASPVSYGFNKTNSSRYATVRVWAPLESTAWNFKLSCPTTLPSVAVYINYFSSITSNDFTAECELVNGTSNVFNSHGICYAIYPTVPTYSSNTQNCGSGNGKFSCSPYGTPLVSGTKYNIKSWAYSTTYGFVFSDMKTITIP